MPDSPLTIDPFTLPSPCRSGRFCELCRSEVRGASFRATHRQTHPEMYGPNLECNFGLLWNYSGPAPWAARFDAQVRAKLQSAAVEEMVTSASFGPGDVVKLVLSRLGYTAYAKCGCEAFREKMNEWGWTGCWSHRREIVEWFAARARESNISVDDEGVWSLVSAGLKDLMRRRR